MKCAYLQSITTPENFKTVTIDSVLSDIKTQKYATAINALPPSSNDKKAYNEAKRHLPAWALNGEFTVGTKNEHFSESNGLFHIDIDGLDNPEAIKWQLSHEIPELYALWISPSGKGLKGLLRIPDDLIHTDSDFKEAYKQIDAYLSVYDVTIDKACKDVRRLCFVCSDADIYINRDAPAFMFDMSKWGKKEVKKPLQTSQPSTNYQASKQDRYIDRCCNLILQSVSGTHHNARLRAGKLAGGFIAAGLVNETTIMQALSQASDSISTQYGDSQSIIQREQKTIYDAIQHGKWQPVEQQQYSEQTGTDNNVIPITYPIPATPEQIAEYEPEDEPKQAFKDAVLPIKHIETICDYINASIYHYSPAATRQAAIAFICHIVSRKYLSDSGDKCSLMIGNIGSTISQLSDINNSLESLFYDVGVGDSNDIRLDRMTYADLMAHYTAPDTSGKLLYMPHDLGHTIRSSQKQTSLAMDGFLAELSQFHDKKTHVFRLKKRETVKKPVVNLYANFDEKDLFTFGKLSNNDGLFNMFLIQQNSSKDFVFNSKKHEPLTDTESFTALKSRVQAITGKTDAVMLPGVKTPGAGQSVIHWSVNPADYAERLKESCGNNSAWTGRAIKQFVNLATAIAAWNDETAVSGALAEQCCDYVCYRVSKLAEALSKRSSDDVSPDVMTRVLSIIHKAGDDGVFESRLLQSCAGFKKLSEVERDDLIMKLIKNREITMSDRTKEKTAGKKGRKFFIK